MNGPALNSGYSYRERVRPQAAGLSVLDYYARFYSHSDRATWAARLAAGEVELNGRQADGSERLRAGDRLVWHRPPWPEEVVPLHFALLYEDADILAVHKPSGLPTLPAGGFLEHTLLTLLRRQWPQATPLHRLGRGTSGLVLCSLSRGAGARLLADWREGRVHKRYRALSAGLAAQDEYDICTPIGQVPHPRLGEVYAAAPQGKASRSRARVLERRVPERRVPERRVPERREGHPSPELPDAQTLFQVDIDTGRPHQIRIHLASVGLPLLGDPLYLPGGAARPDVLPSDLGYWLHAERLEFTHPRSGERLSLCAPVPAGLEGGAPAVGASVQPLELTE